MRRFVFKGGWQRGIYLNPGNDEFYNAVKNLKYMLIKLR